VYNVQPMSGGDSQYPHHMALAQRTQPAAWD
jgi:hypothetical protein